MSLEYSESENIKNDQNENKEQNEKEEAQIDVALSDSEAEEVYSDDEKIITDEENIDISTNPENSEENKN